MAFFGYHDVYETDFFSALRAASQNGFQYVQFDLNIPGLYIDRLSLERLRRIRYASDDLGISISLHAPGDTVGFLVDYRENAIGSLANLSAPTLETVLREEALLSEFLDLCEEYDDAYPYGPGTKQRAGLLAVGVRS